MSLQTVGQIFQLDRTARASLHLFGDKGDFTEASYDELFAKVREAVMAENKLDAVENFWTLPEKTPIGPRASSLLDELLYRLNQVRNR